MISENSCLFRKRFPTSAFTIGPGLQGYIFKTFPVRLRADGRQKRNDIIAFSNQTNPCKPSLCDNMLLVLGISTRGVSELMDRRGCAILALEVIPKNLIFA